jgi:hypothetical protein
MPLYEHCLNSNKNLAHLYAKILKILISYFIFDNMSAIFSKRCFFKV